MLKKNQKGNEKSEKEISREKQKKKKRKILISKLGEGGGDILVLVIPRSSVVSSAPELVM